MMRHKPARRVLVLLALAFFCWTPLAKAIEPGDAGFQDFLQSIWPRAQAQGVRRETFDAAIKDLTPDPTALAASDKQAEFDKPLSSYLSEAVSAARIKHGRAAFKQWRPQLARIS